MRIVQISDTHISRQHRQFGGNVAVVREWIARNAPDLVVHTGDLSMNGAVTRDDLDDAVAWLRDLGLPVLSVPGNHDVGDLPDLRADQILDDERLERYRAIVGEDHWIHDEAGWRLVGINAMLLGTGHRDEIAQYEWLDDALASPHPKIVFLHKPLFVHDPHEGPHGYWTVPPSPRGRILQALSRADVRIVASGHLHVAREKTFAGVRHVWGPSAAFVCGETQPASVPGERRIGLVVHDLSPNAATSRTVFLDEAGCENLEIDPHIDAIYPAPTNPAPERLEAALA